MGKALLFDMAPDAMVKLIGAGPLRAKTPLSITSLPALLKDLAKARANGVAISDEENLPGVFAAGAPLLDADGHVTAAVSLACPAAMADKSARAKICTRVQQTAVQISRRLGAVR